MNALGWAHETYIYNRRIRRLTELLSELVPRDFSLLDVGCGDGKLAWSLLQKRPDLRIRGIDVLLRDSAWLEVSGFDGTKIPLSDASVDGIMLIDVLHHTSDPLPLLQECRRVSRRSLFIKDHVLEGMAARFRLQFMDWCGNSRHGVSLPYNYFSRRDWTRMRGGLGVKITAEINELALYSGITDRVFGGGLHFIEVWEPVETAQGQTAACQDSTSKLGGC